MSEKTDKPAISPELRQKNTFRIHLPAWLGRPGAEFLIRTAATALAFWVVFTFVIGVHICHSQAGAPMIKDGDLFVSFRLSAPERGDLVVYRHGGVLSVGRVFALGGEHVEITPAAVLCDSFRQPDSAGYDAGLSRDFECRVPEGCVFVLNDNRADLSDSRTWESIPLTDCEGPVVFLMRRRGF